MYWVDHGEYEFAMNPVMTELIGLFIGFILWGACSTFFPCEYQHTLCDYRILRLSFHRHLVEPQNEASEVHSCNDWNHLDIHPQHRNNQ